MVEAIDIATSAGSEQLEVQATANFRTVTGRTTVTSSQGENEHALYRGGSVWLASNEFKSYRPGKATFTLNLARATARTPASQRAALHSAIHATGGEFKETGSVWVDSGIVRSLSVRIDGTGPTAGTRLRYQFTLSDVGTHVDVAPPPAKAVVPLQSVPALQERLHSSATSG